MHTTMVTMLHVRVFVCMRVQECGYICIDHIWVKHVKCKASQPWTLYTNWANVSLPRHGFLLLYGRAAKLETSLLHTSVFIAW